MQTDTRSLARQLVDMVLGLVPSSEVPGTHLIFPARENRRSQVTVRDHVAGSVAKLAEAEVALWVAVVEDAALCARAIMLGARLPGSNAAGKYQTRKHAEEAESLRDWVTGGSEDQPFRGSLPWIADHLGVGPGAVEQIRRAITSALAGSARLAA